MDRASIDVQLRMRCAIRAVRRAALRAAVAALRAAIEAGELPAGRKLPPERLLASYLDVGRRTVARAYEALSDRALVDRRQGAGTRVDRPARPARRRPRRKRTTSLQRNIVFGSLSQSAAPVIDLLSVYAPGGTTVTAEALHAAADVIATLPAAHHGYAPAGYEPLREAIAARYSASGLPTTAEQILVTSGAQQATTLVASDLVSPVATVLIEVPTIPVAIDVFGRSARTR